MMNPATLSIITATFAPRERGKAIGIWAGVSAMALAIGPLVGGLLTEHVNWNWIFYVNVPVGIAGLFAIPIFIDESRDESMHQRLDIPGLVASAVGLFSLTYAFIEANNYGWSSARILGAFAIALVAGAAFLLLERHQRAPMLDLSLFRNRTFAGANASMLFVGLAMFGTFFYVSLYMQNVLHYSPVEAGASFLPMTLLIILIAPRAGALTDRVRLALARRRRHDTARRDALLLLAARRQRELLEDPARAADRRSRHGHDDDAGDGGRHERGRGRQGGRRFGGPQLGPAGGRLPRDRDHGLDRRGRERLPHRLPWTRSGSGRCSASPVPPCGDGDPQDRASARARAGARRCRGRGRVTETKQRLTADARRQAVLDTACRVFSRSSYRGATRRKSRARPASSEPILYRHFGSKRDPSFACLDEAWAAFRAESERAIAADPAKCLGAIADAYMAKGKRLRVVDLWIQALTVAPEDKVIAAALRKQIREVHEFFAEIVSATASAAARSAADRDEVAEAWISSPAACSRRLTPASAACSATTCSASAASAGAG